MEWQWALLLLPVAFILGWLVAKRKNKKTRRQLRFSNDYFQGLNYLLNDEQDKALDVFLRLVEIDWETIDTSLTLANIFRRKGEIDKSIKLHQNLLARPSLPTEYKSRVLLELGRDYHIAGWLDRAEGLFNEILSDEDYAQEALLSLINIYQQEQEWQSAINAARRCHRKSNQNLLPVIAQYYCELSETALADGDAKEAEALATQALSTDENCVRASIVLADIAIERGRYKKAIRFLQQVEFQQVEYMPLVVDRLITCFRNQSNLQSLVTYFKNIQRNHKEMSLLPTVIDLISEVYDTESALDYLKDCMKDVPTLDGIKKVLELKKPGVDCPENDLHDVIDHMIKNTPDFQCSKCGYAANTLYWLCPSCHTWAGMKPK